MTTKSLRLNEDLDQQTEQLAARKGLKFSDYTREALEEKNLRELAADTLQPTEAREIIDALSGILAKLSAYDETAYLTATKANRDSIARAKADEQAGRVVTKTMTELETLAAD